MGKMSELDYITEEVIQRAIETRGYGYGSVIDALYERTDVSVAERDYLIEHFKEMFGHDSH